MDTVFIAAPKGYSVKPDTLASFAGMPRYAKLTGPGKLIRLVQFQKVTREGEHRRASQFAGDCWMTEQLFQRYRASARDDLAVQNGTDSGVPDPERDAIRMELYMKFTLRDGLAVCRNWSDFDAYISLEIGPKETLTVLTGKIKAQPYYSPKHEDHALAAKEKIELQGSEDQYVIDFSYPDNKRFAQRVQQCGPVRL